MHAILGPAGWLSPHIVFHSVIPLAILCLVQLAVPCPLQWTALPNLQAVSRGLAGPFLIKLGSQPQIVSAYAPSAPVRAAALVQELAASLQSLQVWASPVSPPCANFQCLSQDVCVAPEHFPPSS